MEGVFPRCMEEEEEEEEEGEGCLGLRTLLYAGMAVCVGMGICSIETEGAMATSLFSTAGGSLIVVTANLLCSL